MTREDVHNLSQAVEALKIIKEGELGEEKEALKELQQEREEYNEVLIIDIRVSFLQNIIGFLIGYLQLNCPTKLEFV